MNVDEWKERVKKKGLVSEKEEMGSNLKGGRDESEHREKEGEVEKKV